MLRISLIAGLATLAIAAPAQAAGFNATLTPRIQGAGSIASVCDASAQLDDRIVTTCAPSTLPAGQRTLVAVPAPGTDSTFVRWDGCSVVIGTGCTLIALPGMKLEPTAVFADDRAPSLNLTPLPFLNRATVSLSFGSDDPTASFECATDGGTASPCAPGAQFTLPTGRHTIMVKAIDPSGNESAPASTSFGVDATPPAVIFDAGTPADGAQLGPDYFASWKLSETGTTTCSLDGTTPEPCDRWFSANHLAPTSHALTITATDTIGNRSTITRHWTANPAPTPIPTPTPVPSPTPHP
jgi:hypothetical protein